MTKPIVLVTGATGQQGGGVVSALLADGSFTVRALTRNTTSAAAKALVEKGAQVVQGDADNYESLVQALEGAYGAYFVTNFWEHLDYKREVQQAANYAKASKQVGLKHAVWSTLDDTRKVLEGKFKPLVDDLITPHFDAKAIANQEFVKNDVPTTFLLTSMYMDNFASFLGPKKGPDGNYAFGLPFPSDLPLVLIAVADIGHAVLSILKDTPKYTGKTLSLAGDKKTLPELAQAFTQALGVQIHPVSFPREVYLSFGFPGVEDMTNMFEFYATQEFLNSRSVEETNKLSAPATFKTFDQWLQENKDRIKATL